MFEGHGIGVPEGRLSGSGVSTLPTNGRIHGCNRLPPSFHLSVANAGGGDHTWSCAIRDPDPAVTGTRPLAALVNRGVCFGRAVPRRPAHGFTPEAPSP